ncbi:MAG: GntR family transcriptional regulator [Syntrophales bacterium]
MAERNLHLGKLLPAPSLKEMALATIKEAMFAKKLEQEVMYTEAALTSELGISRTPVREALIHLASRGLITYFPRKGFKIKLLTERDVENLFEFRLALELAAIRHVVPLLTKPILAEIERIQAQYRKIAQQGEPLDSIRANMMFHACLAELTENSYLIGALEEIRDLSNLAGLRSLEVGTRTGEAIGEHERIVAELKERSLSGALCEMEAHIRTTEARVLARVRATKK